MNSSNNLSNRSWESSERWLVGAQIGLAVIGLIIATWLTATHVRGTVPPCSIVSGCRTVLGSKYAEIGRIPTASLGMAYYVTLVVLGVAYLQETKAKWVHLSLRLTVIGAALSAYLVYLQLFVINAICLYCMASALVCFLLLGVEMVIWRRYVRYGEEKEVVQSNI